MKQNFTTLLILILLSTNLTAQIITNGLVGYWPFNGNANDESTNTNNGIVNGAVLTTDRFGNNNSAYYFDGTNDFIEVLQDTVLKYNNITLSAWIKTSTIGNLQDGDWMDIISYGDNAHVLAIDENGNLLGGLQGTDSNCEFPGSTIVSTNLWTFVTMTRISNNITTYINGQKHLMDSCHYSVIYNDSIHFGHDPTGNGEFFEGIIDDISIYNRALDSTEVLTMYGNTSSIKSNIKNRIKIYPNPNNGEFSIEFNHLLKDTYNISILNALGKTVKQLKSSYPITQIDLGTVENGVYLIQIKTPEKILLVRVIKQ